MAFWSTQRIEREQTAQRLLDPYDPENLHQGAYELTLSQQSVTTSPEGKEQRIRGQPRAFIIAPGQFAVLHNREIVKIPDGVIAFISVKSSFKANGLINISGFHVDPGYEGRLRFSVYNAGSQPVVLKLGDPTFQLWFADMDEPTRDPYQGTHQGQLELTPVDLAMTLERPASPAVLARRIDELELKFQHLSAVFYAVVVTLMGAVCVCLAGVALAALLAYLQANASAAAKPGTTPQPAIAKP